MKNLLTRTLFGLLYLAVMVACLLLSKYLFLILMLAVMAFMMNEFHSMHIGSSFPVQQFLALLTGVTFFVLLFLEKVYILDPGVLVIGFVPLFIQFGSLLFLKDRTELDKVFVTFASVLYIALPLTLFNMLVFRNYVYHGELLLSIFVLVWMSDIGAYVFGMLLGQKYGPKLCPTISPKKSWIGVAGGVVVTIGSALLLHRFSFLPFNGWHCAALAVIVCFSGIVGDLVESVWKRHCDIKDSGNVIPGHGGMMDRFDSALFAVPACAVYLYCAGLM